MTFEIATNSVGSGPVRATAEAVAVGRDVAAGPVMVAVDVGMPVGLLPVAVTCAVTSAVVVAVGARDGTAAEDVSVGIVDCGALAAPREHPDRAPRMARHAAARSRPGPWVGLPQTPAGGALGAGHDGILLTRASLNAAGAGSRTRPR